MFVPVLLMVVLLWIQAPEGCYGRGNTSGSRKESYAVLVDAGSTGSRMHVCKLHLNRKGKLSDVSDFEELDNSLGKVKPGLSSFADNMKEIPRYLKTFVDEAKKIVPREGWKRTPFLLLATAGMRLLSKEDQDKIIDMIKRVLKNKKIFSFRYEDNFVKVISGEDEAVFGWITVNFVQGILTSPRRRLTYGVLDMGGASTQNAFRNPKGQVNLMLGGRWYKLFAKSYLNMGLATVHDRYLEFLAEWPDKTKDSEGNTVSPCHHNGFKEVFQVQGASHLISLSVIGDPDSEKCRKIVDVLFFCEDSPTYADCPFKDQPKLRGKLVAFAAFHRIIDRIGGLICENKPVSVEQIGCAAKKFCSKPYNVVKPIDEGYVKFSCLWGNYVYELLHKGYQIADDEEIFVVTTLNGFELSWILGAVVHTLGLL